MKRFDESSTLPEALRQAARASIRIAANPESGLRPQDPLRRPIPGDGDITTDVRDAVTVVAGNFRHRRPPFGEAANPAPAARDQLRRWAMKHG